MTFQDRTEAGKLLGARLAGQALFRPVVLALPRGGVPVGYEVALALGAPLDVILVRKIGVPWHRELALGAIAEGDPPEVVVNETILAELGIGSTYIQEESEAQLKEIKRRRRLYLGSRAPLLIQDRTAVVVDDGIATGATMRAALRAVRRRDPRSIVLGIPVAPPETIDALRGEADEVVCLETPLDFSGVGQFYAHFPQTADTTVVDLLKAADESLNRPRRK